MVNSSELLKGDFLLCAEQFLLRALSAEGLHGGAERRNCLGHQTHGDGNTPLDLEPEGETCDCGNCFAGLLRFNGRGL